MEAETPSSFAGKPQRTRAPKGEPPENWVSLFGFVIVTKADLLAAAAFLLSLTTLLFQITDKVSGARPTIYPPETGYIFFDKYANNQVNVRFLGQLSFVNSGSAGHDTIVRDIRLNVQTGPSSIQQSWFGFVSVSREGIHLNPTPIESAHPFPVTSGNAVSHLISFAPQEVACPTDGGTTTAQACNPGRDFISDIEFLKRIQAARFIKMTFSVRYVGENDRHEVSCSLPVTISLKQYLVENGWYAARCVEDNPISWRSSILRWIRAPFK